MIELGVRELAATRFAVSPLSETVACLQQLAGQDRHVAHQGWFRWAEGELAESPLDLPLTWSLLVSSRPNWPEFLVPAPREASTTIDDDLARLEKTSAGVVRCSIRRVFGQAPPPSAASFAAAPAGGLRALAAELRTAHDRLVAPHWPRIQAVLEADVGYRARQLASGGAAKLFADLHRDLRWDDGRLMLTGDRWRIDTMVDRGPGGLVLMPVALGSPHVLIKKRTSTQTTVRYPARGVGTLWVRATPSPAGHTARLLGRARADVLDAVRTPSTTTDLARRLGVTPSAVSQHLRILRESGLVERERSGRLVVYTTTALGERLL